MTITMEIQSAATAPKQGELASHFLSYEFIRQIQAATVLPFEVDDCSTELDAWMLARSNYNRFAGVDPLSMPALTSHIKDQSIRSARIDDLIVRSSSGRRTHIYEFKTTTGDPAPSIYRFVSMNDQTTHPSSATSILKGLLEKSKADDPIKGYEQFSQANWDSYDAEPITSETLQYARRLLSVIPETFGSPDIAPSADGSIGLEWVPQSGPVHKLFLDIGPGQKWRAYWTRRGGEFGRQAGVSFDLNTKVTLQKLFSDLCR